MIEWNPDPEIISVGFLSLRWYSLFFMLSFLLGIYFFRYVYRREAKPLADLDTLLMYMLAGTIIGARLGHCLFYDPSYYLSNPVKILMVWEGGLASHGAAIGILLALYIYAHKRPDQTYLWLLDRMVIPIALAGMFIRLGNLMNSEIIGAPADVPWAFIFVRVDNIPRHPSQLYEALAYLLIFVFLLQIYRKHGAATPRGSIFGWFLSLIFGFRIFVEFFKENQSAFEAGMILNMGQLLSIPLVLVGIYFIFSASQRVKMDQPKKTVAGKRPVKKKHG